MDKHKKKEKVQRTLKHTLSIIEAQKEKIKIFERREKSCG